MVEVVVVLADEKETKETYTCNFSKVREGCLELAWSDRKPFKVRYIPLSQIKFIETTTEKKSKDGDLSENKV